MIEGWIREIGRRRMNDMEIYDVALKQVKREMRSDRWRRTLENGEVSFMSCDEEGCIYCKWCPVSKSNRGFDHVSTTCSVNSINEEISNAYHSNMVMLLLV